MHQLPDADHRHHLLERNNFVDLKAAAKYIPDKALNRLSAKPEWSFSISTCFRMTCLDNVTYAPIKVKKIPKEKRSPRRTWIGRNA